MAPVVFHLDSRGGGRKWSASRPGLFIPGSDGVRGWMGSRGVLGALERAEIY